jgi:hypothetical protein
MLARMKPDMIELAESPHKLIVPENFFEGPWIFKRNALYYLTCPAFRPGGVGRGGHGQMGLPANFCHGPVMETFQFSIEWTTY